MNKYSSYTGIQLLLSFHRSNINRAQHEISFNTRNYLRNVGEDVSTSFKCIRRTPSTKIKRFVKENTKLFDLIVHRSELKITNCIEVTFKIIDVLS